MLYPIDAIHMHKQKILIIPLDNQNLSLLRWHISYFIDVSLILIENNIVTACTNHIKTRQYRDILHTPPIYLIAKYYNSFIVDEVIWSHAELIWLDISLLQLSWDTHQLQCSSIQGISIPGEERHNKVVRRHEEYITKSV